MYVYIYIYIYILCNQIHGQQHIVTPFFSGCMCQVENKFPVKLILALPFESGTKRRIQYLDVMANILFKKFKTIRSNVSKNIYISTVEPPLSGPRLPGFLDYPDFFSGPNLVMNIY